MMIMMSMLCYVKYNEVLWDFLDNKRISSE